MAITPNLAGASKAYQISKEIASRPVPAGFNAASMRPSESAVPVSFSDVVKNTAIETIGTIKAGDHAATAGLRGELPIQQVVEATMAMETALQLTVNIRDKVLEAYQEVMRMAV